MNTAAGRDDAAPRSSSGAGAGASWAEATAEKIATTARTSTMEILEVPEIAIESERNYLREEKECVWILEIVSRWNESVVFGAYL